MPKEYEFKDVKFLTADEKRKILKDWERFLSGGCLWKDFTERLYHHLIQHCEFIAHYDRGGFYGTYFAEGENQVQFLSQFDNRGPLESIEYGGTSWINGPDGDYKDINTAMIEVAAKYIPHLIEDAKGRQKEKDIATARALLEKHGITETQEGISPFTRGVLSTIKIPSTELWRFSIEELRAECRKRSLPWSGTKEDLIRRLKKLK